MKTKKEAAVQDAKGDDARRLAYMIAWRDRYIEALQEQLAGTEEKQRLLCALLHYALAAIGKAQGGEETFEVKIPKNEVARALDAWECRAEGADDGYTVRFEKRKAAVPDDGDRANGGEEAKG